MTEVVKRAKAFARQQRGATTVAPTPLTC